MKPYIHARSSAKKYGGKPEDYMDLHQEMDNTKSAIADVRHRVVMHSSYGCFLIEKIFGATRVNSAGKTYSTRDVAEDHIIEDLGFIPSLDKWLSHMSIEPWMGGKVSKERKHIPFTKPGDEVVVGPSTKSIADELEAARPYIELEECIRDLERETNIAHHPDSYLPKMIT